MSKIIIGIDPGKSGGIAWWNPLNDRVYVEPMLATEGDIVEFIKSFCLHSKKFAFIEKIPKYAGKDIPGSAMAVLYGNYCFIKGVLMTESFRIEEITPQAWQKDVGAGTRSKCIECRTCGGRGKCQATADDNSSPSFVPVRCVVCKGKGKITQRLSDSVWKKKLKGIAQKLYPVIFSANGKPANITYKTADALLILEYGRNKMK